jgi:hypothetical protein
MGVPRVRKDPIETNRARLAVEETEIGPAGSFVAELKSEQPGEAEKGHHENLFNQWGATRCGLWDGYREIQRLSSRSNVSMGRRMTLFEFHFGVFSCHGGVPNFRISTNFSPEGLTKNVKSEQRINSLLICR